MPPCTGAPAAAVPPPVQRWLSVESQRAVPRPVRRMPVSARGHCRPESSLGSGGSQTARGEGSGWPPGGPGHRRGGAGFPPRQVVPGRSRWPTARPSQPARETPAGLAAVFAVVQPCANLRSSPARPSARATGFRSRPL
jgi:hypothetical protein